MTLRESFEKTFGWAIPVMVAAVLIMSYVWYVDTAQMGTGAGMSDEIMAIRDHAPGTVDAVIEKHNCVEHQSTGPHDYPSAVIFQTNDGRAHYSTNVMHIGKALEEGLGGADWKGHTVNLFCE